jgi:hypothetical protein
MLNSARLVNTTLGLGGGKDCQAAGLGAPSGAAPCAA